MTKLLVEDEKSLTAISKMHDACLFLDGPFMRFPVRLGDRVAFSASNEPITVLGLDQRRARKPPQRPLALKRR